MTPLTNYSISDLNKGVLRPEERAFIEVAREEGFADRALVKGELQYHESKADFRLHLYRITIDIDIKDRNPNSVQHGPEITRDFLKQTAFPLIIVGSFRPDEEGMALLSKSHVTLFQIPWQYESDPNAWRMAVKLWLRKLRRRIRKGLTAIAKLRALAKSLGHRSPVGPSIITRILTTIVTSAGRLSTRIIRRMTSSTRFEGGLAPCLASYNPDGGLDWLTEIRSSGGDKIPSWLVDKTPSRKWRICPKCRRESPHHKIGCSEWKGRVQP